MSYIFTIEITDGPVKAIEIKDFGSKRYPGDRKGGIGIEKAYVTGDTLEEAMQKAKDMIVERQEKKTKKASISQPVSTPSRPPPSSPEPISKLPRRRSPPAVSLPRS